RSTIKPMKTAFDRDFVKLIDGPNIKKGKNKYEQALQIKEDIESFRKTSRASRLVTCWCGSTESFVKPEDAHSTPEKFVEAMKSNHPAIAPSMLYAWMAQSPDDWTSSLRQTFPAWNARLPASRMIPSSRTSRLPAGKHAKSCESFRCLP